MEALQNKGLHINTAKSAFLLTMGGTNFRAVRSGLIQRTSAGERIKIHGDHQTFDLPVLHQTKYLGTLISYGSFEDATTKLRVSHARLAFTRLKKWLTARRGLAVKERMRLWSTCGFPVLTYGIFTIGLTTKGLQMLQHTMISMIRQIHHDHAYLTGRSNEHALLFHGVAPPLLWLWTTADSLYQSVTKMHPHSTEFDLCQTFDWTALQQTIDFIHHQHAKGLTVPSGKLAMDEATPSPCLTCPLCDFATYHLPVLRRHMTCTHNLPRFRRHVPNPAQYMKHGLPQCTMCDRTFTTWRSFNIHVQRGCQDTTLEQRQARPVAPFPENAAPGLALSTGAIPKLTKEELHSIQQHEFGPRLLTLIHQRSWDDLLRERAGCTFLSRNCLLCGQFIGRAQAMHHHFRLMHSAYSNLVHSKATQLTNLMSDEAPCSACGVIFNSTHSCNVWFQVAMLIVHGPKPATDVHAKPLDTMQCEICGVHCSSAQELHAHLQKVHRLISSVWHESRDSCDGKPICNHCKQDFKNLESLRSHINQGRCAKFNPDLTTTPTEVLLLWKEACCQGRLEDILSDPHNKLRLTLRCQCCPKKYTRSADLSAHLQGSHAEIWMAAQPFVHQLVQGFYGSLGCVCNPSCNVNRLHHVCMPFLQLSMQFARLKDAMFLPAKQTVTEIARVLPPHVPVDLRGTLELALANYDLDSLWTDALLMDALSGTCVFCGHDLLPAELNYHLHEAHMGVHPIVKAYVLQLLPHAYLHSDSDCACFACGQIFNLPVTNPDAAQTALRQQLVQTHLRAQCPSVLQLAVLLAHLQHGAARLANGAGRCVAADAADLPEHCAASGQQPETGSQSSSAQKAKTGTGPCRSKRQKLTHKGPATADRSTEAPSPDGPPASESGSRPPGAPARNHIHHLLQQSGTDRHPSSAPAGSQSMASAIKGGVIIIEDAAETSLASVGGEGTDRAADQADRGPSRLSSPGSGTEDQHRAGEQHDSLHGMGCLGEAAEGGSQNTGEPDQDGRTSPGTSRGVQGCQPNPEIPLLANQAGQCDHTLATPDVLAGGSHLRAHAAPGTEPNMDTHCGQPQAAQPLPELPCGQPGSRSRPEAKQGPGQGEDQNQGTQDAADQAGEVIPTQQQLLEAVSKMVLINPNNWCFCNTAAYSLFWTVLTLSCYEPAMWGIQSHDIMRFLLASRQTPMNLAAQQFFRDIMHTWGRDEIGRHNFSISQQDSSEFVQVWLQMMQTSVFQMQWEKRMSAADATHVMDSNQEACAPLCLKFDDALMLSQFCTLTSLVKTWHQADGMRSAFLSSSPCVCIHIDRCVMGPELTVYKCTSKLQIDEVCCIPVFQDGSIACEFHEYTVVAVMSHLGQDGAGHYRAALRTRPQILRQTSPVQWLVTDDWRAPEPTWMPKDWMQENITMAWLVRTDVLHLPYYRAEPETPTTSTAELMRLLNAAAT